MIEKPSQTKMVGQPLLRLFIIFVIYYRDTELQTFPTKNFAPKNPLATIYSNSFKGAIIKLETFEFGGVIFKFGTAPGTPQNAKNTIAFFVIPTKMKQRKRDNGFKKGRRNHCYLKR